MNSKQRIVEKRGSEAFTFLELVVVIGVIGMLAALLLPALAATRPASEGFQCLENQRRFVLAWRLYSDDNSGELARNGGFGYTALSTNDPNINNGNWVHGLMGTAATTISSTDPALIKAGVIFPYANNVTIYKCPADRKTIVSNGVRLATTRSISMNAWLNPFVAWNANSRAYRNQADITNPAPANLWVALDESPGTMNDPIFVCDANPLGTQWVDIPAAYHVGGSGISFADGHAMIRRWTDTAVLRGDSVTFTISGQTPPTDLQWLRARSTSRK